MNETNRHTISRLRWETSFDEKKKATELQSRLSHWSHFKMEQELKGVFDNIQPGKKVWRIDKLEIDLGTIHYTDLEAELVKRIKMRLQEVLIAMQRAHSGKYPGEQRILSHEETLLEAVQSFLMYGILPWHFTQEQRPVNDLLLEQLLNNRAACTDMLCQLAGKSRQVRRRIAWQLTEPVIIKIIEEVEPAGSKTIIGFAHDLTNVQKQRNIIQAPAGEFKKNIWYWVLNYLFTTHGSVFNKKEFLKSSIRQMAAHYNISYLELLNIIGLIVSKISQPVHYTDGFTALLAVLSKEEKTGNKTASFQLHDEPDEAPGILKYIIQNESRSLSNEEKRELNALIKQLAGKQPQAIWKWLTAGNTSRDQIRNVAGQLTARTFETLLNELKIPFARILAHEIYYAVKKLNTQNRKAIRHIIQEAAFNYILDNGPVSVSAERLLGQLLNCLMKQGTLTDVLPVLEQLVDGGSQVPDKYFRGNPLEIRFAAWALLLQQPGSVIEQRMKQVLNELADKRNSSAAFHAGAGLVARYLQTHPAISFKILEKHTDKVTINKVLLYCLTEELAAALKHHLDNNRQVLLSNLSAFISSPACKAGEKLKLYLGRHLYSEGIKVTLQEPGKNIDTFFELLISGISGQVPAALSGEFELFIKNLADAGVNFHSAVTEYTKKRIKKLYTPVPVKEYALVELPATANTMAVSRALQLYCLNKSSKKYPEINSSAVLPLVSKLLNNPLHHYSVLVSDFAPKYQRRQHFMAVNRVEEILHEVFWVILLDYNCYKGNSHSFTRAFLRLLSHHLPAVPLTRQKKQVPAKDTESALIRLFKNHYRDDIITAGYDGSNYSIAALAEKLIVNDPKRLLNLVRNIPDSQAGTTILHYCGDFKRTISLILSGLEGLPCYYAIQMLQYYEKAEIKLQSDKLRLLDELFISHLYELIRGAIPPATVYKNLLKAPLVNGLIDQAGSIHQSGKEKNAMLFRGSRSTWLNGILNALFINEDVPGWIKYSTEEKLLNELLAHFPYEVLRLLNTKKLTGIQLQWLISTCDAGVFITAAMRVNPSDRSRLKLLAEFYEALKDKNWGAIAPAKLQAVVFRTIIEAYTGKHKPKFQAENIWYELVWELSTRCQVPESVLLRDIKENSANIPPPLMQALARVSLREDRNQKIKQTTLKPMIAPAMKKIIEQQAGKNAGEEGITVLNAGLVIISSYLPMFFERLGICEGNSFINEDVQAEAVHYLQYIVTGSNCTEESLLPLNKIMCGLDISQPVPLEINITSEAKELAESLISAFIGFWPAIGHTSVDGFRGNWLVRTGLLKETEEKWELTVEKKSYDVLLARSPFSFSVVKFPWMKKPMHVTWPN